MTFSRIVTLRHIYLFLGHIVFVLAKLIFRPVSVDTISNCLIMSWRPFYCKQKTALSPNLEWQPLSVPFFDQSNFVNMSSSARLNNFEDILYPCLIPFLIGKLLVDSCSLTVALACAEIFLIKFLYWKSIQTWFISFFMPNEIERLLKVNKGHPQSEIILYRFLY